MLEAPKPKHGNNTVLVHINFATTANQEDQAEFYELAKAAGAEVDTMITGTRALPDAKYFVGRGKVAEIHQYLQGNDVELVMFNHVLTPAQERNLENLLCCRVLDRIGLILDIFAQRARSFEGKLQVELAQLQYLASRLKRGWTHLERQQGGIGMRGPGETQLETDKRLIQGRINKIKSRLNKVKKQRDQERKARRKVSLPTVSLVGYTNAGKSTLFNQLTTSEVLVADQLFATLDPTLRQLHLPGSNKIILTDTVGFIRHLPHDLVEAFSATLEETRDATLLLHVIDANDPERQSHTEQVKQVLQQIGADQIPILEVYNKIDEAERYTPYIQRDQYQQPTRVYISAQQNQGLDLLMKAITELTYGQFIHDTVTIHPQQGRLRSQLYDMQAVQQESYDDQGNTQLKVKMAKQDYRALFNKKAKQRSG